MSLTKELLSIFIALFLCGGLLAQSGANPKPYEVFQRKNMQYEKIEYSVEKGQYLYYLNNNKLQQNFLLWCVNADSFVAPLPAQLPEGYSFQKVLYPITTKFTMHYRKSWNFIMDENYNMRIRNFATSPHWFQWDVAAMRIRSNSLSPKYLRLCL